MEAVASQEDIEKLKALGQVPTDVQSIEDQIRQSSEGKNAFDAVGIFMGAGDPEIDGMLQRTNFQSVEENFTISQCLYLAKYGCRPAWVKINGEKPKWDKNEWEMPELKQLLLWIIEGRPSVGGISREQAMQAIQGLKITLAANRSPLSGP